MTLFDEEWALLLETSRSGHQQISPELVAHLRLVYETVQKEPASPANVKSALEQLFAYLVTREGRTDVHCGLVDRFFCVGGGWEWERFPEDYRAVANDIGNALHNAVTNPAVAEAFYCLPEQLLRRIRAL